MTAHNSQRLLYLDNAATSFPKPPPVVERMQTVLDEFGGCPGRGGYKLARQSSSVLDQARLLLAELFGVREPSRIALTFNATDALNMAIKGVLEPGDHVVTTVMEHNSVTRPLNGLEARGVIEVTRVPASSEGRVDPDAIRRAMTPKTKLVVVIHASNVTGTLQPIESIGPLVRERGALFLVDAAQTAGAYPIDVEASRIDLLAFPGHKSLLGPQGTGGLYVGPRASVRPWREGGTGSLSECPYQPDELPLRLEAGSHNTLGVALLVEAVRFVLDRQPVRIRDHELDLVQRLLHGLREDRRFTLYGPSEISKRIGIVSFNLAGTPPGAVADLLDRRHQIAVRAGLQCAPGAHEAIGTCPDGTVRISVGFATTAAQIDRCLTALRDTADQLGAGAPSHARR